jgi:hypothetical protein
MSGIHIIRKPYSTIRNSGVSAFSVRLPRHGSFHTRILPKGPSSEDL